MASPEQPAPSAAQADPWRWRWAQLHLELRAEQHLLSLEAEREGCVQPVRYAAMADAVRTTLGLMTKLERQRPPPDDNEPIYTE